MSCLKQIFVIFVAFHLSEASKSIYSSEGFDMSWIMKIPEWKKRTGVKPIVDTFVGKSNHSFALLRCDNLFESNPNRCDVTIRTHSLDDQVFEKICKIHPPPEDQRDIVKINSITFLRGDRLLVSWREKNKVDGLRQAFNIVFADSCEESDFIYVKDEWDNFYPILRFKNYFEILFTDSTIEACSKTHYCRVTYSYDGKLLNDPLPFELQGIAKNVSYFSINRPYTINYGSNDGVVLIVEKNIAIPANVYSPIIGWIKADKLYHNDHVYSNTSGFATLCWKQDIGDNYSFNCTWLDGTHKNMTIGFNRLPYLNMPAIYNTPNGTIMLINPGVDDDGSSSKIFVDEFDHVENKCKRIAHISIDSCPIEHLHFTMPENDRICVSYTTYDCGRALSHNAPRLVNEHFITKCAKVNLDNYKYVECSHNYYI